MTVVRTSGLGGASGVVVNAATIGNHDYASLSTAAAAVPAGGSLYLPAGTWTNTTGHVTLPAGATVYGDGPNSVINGYGFTVSTGCRVRDLQFVGDLGNTKRAIRADDTTSQTNVFIENNLFVNYASAIYLDRTADSSQTEGWHITRNHFSGCVTGIFAIRGNRHLIQGNTFKTAQNTARSIQFWGGQGNRIIGNDITYGTTGIIFLFDRNTAGVKGVIRGNVVSGNIVRDCSEEAISFDCHGNLAASVSVLDRDTVSSTSTSGGNKVILASSGWASAGAAWVGYYLCFNTGALAGQVTRITAQSNATFTTELNSAQLAAVTAGDTVIIGAPIMLNSITGNYVDSLARGTTASISLYGLCYSNSVVGNTVIGSDIIVRGLNSLVKATGQFTNTFGMAPCESNSIVGNTGQRAGIVVDYLDFGSSSLFMQRGNAIVGNVTRSAGITLKQQEYVASANITDVTVSLTNATASSKIWP